MSLFVTVIEKIQIIKVEIFLKSGKWRSIFGSMLVKIKKKEYIFIEEHDYLY